MTKHSKYSSPGKTFYGILHPEEPETFDNLVNGLACHYERLGKGLSSPHAADKYTLEYVYDQLTTYINKEKAKAELAGLQNLKGWIERNHLGKGFDGKDRWEMCAAEITNKITELEAQLAKDKEEQ